MAIIQPPGVTRARLSTILRSSVYSPVSSRVPGVYDDTTQGVTVGRLWIAPGKQRWDARSVTATAARWQRKMSSPLLAGDIASGLVAAYGMRRVVSAYTGACITVVRASDSTSKDISFLSSGALDTATLDAFISGTTGRISQWWDQSGNARHATQATDTNRPLVTPFDYFGTAARGVFFDNGVTSNGTVTNYTSPQSVTKVRQWLSLPTTVTTNANSLSIVSLASFGHALRNQPIVELSADTGVGASQPVSFGYSNSTNSITVVCPLSTNTANATTRNLVDYHGSLAPTVCAMTGSGTNTLTIYGDDRQTYTNGVLGNTALKGGLIGGTTKFNDGGGDADYGYNVQAALLIFSAGMSATAYTDTAAALYADFGVTPQRSGVWVADGDSITEGAWGEWFQSWPRQANAQLQRELLAYNTGIGGSLMSGQSAASQMNKWTPLLAAAAPFKLATCGAGSNDLAASTTAATIAGYDATWISRVRTAAPDAKIYMVTIIPRRNLTAGQDAERVAVNASRRNYAALGADGVIDLAGDADVSAWAVAGVSYDGTKLTDGTHPTPLGYSILASIAASVINPLLAPT